MCYSEKLDREAGGYAEEHGYVLIGWKIVFAPHPRMLLPWNCLGGCSINESELSEIGYGMRAGAMPSALHLDPRTMRQFLDPKVMQVMIVNGFEKVENPVFYPRTLMTDQHGFHVASTELGAMKSQANPFGIREIRVIDPPQITVGFYNPRALLPATMPEYTIKIVTEVKKPGALCRVLIPEHAIDDTNHAHAMVLIPPGEKETPADIAMCNQWNEQNRPEPAPSPVDKPLTMANA